MLWLEAVGCLVSGLSEGIDAAMDEWSGAIPVGRFYRNVITKMLTRG
jgi:hypothetical protein